MANSPVTIDQPTFQSGHLTSLRGIACMVVLFGHVSQIINYDAGRDAPWVTDADRVITGALNAEGAVLLFFVLSGCVLAISLNGIQTFDSRVVLGFYIKRIFRLYPLLWLATPLAIVSVFASHSMAERGAFVPWLTRNLESPVTLPHTLLALAGVWTEYDGPTWSLRVELIYSALFPVIYILVRNQHTRKWLIAALLGLACLPYFHPQYGAAYGFAFAIGALIPQQSRPAAKLPVAIIIGAVILLCYDRTALNLLHPDDAVYNIIESLAAFVIVQHVLFNGGSFHLLGAKPIAWLGDISFSVYLLHLPILLIIMAVAQHYIGLQPILQYPLMVQIGLSITTCSLTVAASGLTYTYIERPLHQTGRRLAATLTQDGPARSLERPNVAIQSTLAQ